MHVLAKLDFAQPHFGLNRIYMRALSTFINQNKSLNIDSTSPWFV